MICILLNPLSSKKHSKHHFRWWADNSQRRLIIYYEVINLHPLMDGWLWNLSLHQWKQTHLDLFLLAQLFSLKSDASLDDWWVKSMIIPLWQCCLLNWPFKVQNSSNELVWDTVYSICLFSLLFFSVTMASVCSQPFFLPLLIIDRGSKNLPLLEIC